MQRNSNPWFIKSCVLGIVEFVEPAEARTAFKRLAYSRFKNLPLYLEWAPEDTFVTSPKEKEKISENDGIVHKLKIAQILGLGLQFLDKFVLY